MSNFVTPKTPTRAAPTKNTVRATVERLSRAPTPPWLSRPIYNKFLQAVNFNSMEDDVTNSDMSPSQIAMWRHLHLHEEFTEEFAHVGMALAYTQSDLIRSHLNALFFGGADEDTVCIHTQLSKESVNAYVELFCDMSVFQNVRLFKMEYVQLMPEVTEADKTERELYKMAVDFGWQWVVWRLTRGLDGHRSNTQIIDTMINMAMYRGLESGAYALDSSKSREGRQYVKLAAQLAISRHAAKIGQTTSMQELAIKLSSMSPDEAQGILREMMTEQNIPIPKIEELLYESDNEFDTGAWNNN